MSEETERQPLYKVGDKVKVINYGHLMWISKMNEPRKTSFPLIGEDESVSWHDMSADIVGMEGIVIEVKNTQNTPRYAIHGIPQKKAWYVESQMELIK